MKEIITSFANCVQRFEEVLNQEPNTIIRDAAIQRFEFTVELGWKSIQKFLRTEEIICRSPKECLKEAFIFGLVQDDPLWIEMMEDRNLTSHTYDETIAQDVFSRLPQYLPLFKQLLKALQEK